MVESTVAGVVFALAFPLTGGNLALSLIIAIVAAFVVFVVALVQRRSVRQAVGGLFGVGIMAAYAAWRGDPTAFYFLGIVKNAAYGAVYLISVLGPLLGEGLSWRKDPARMRAYTWASLLWAGMFGLRVAVQLPLYLAGATTALGFANIPLGLPLFLPVCAATWLILRGTHPSSEDAEVAEDVAVQADQLPADQVAADPP
jgi:hypothetical protein